MLKTELTTTRRNAPGGWTLARMARFFASRRYPRAAVTIGDFERGKYLAVEERFLELWGAALGLSLEQVREMYARVRRQRERAVGPFAGRTPEKKQKNSC